MLCIKYISYNDPAIFEPCFQDLSSVPGGGKREILKRGLVTSFNYRRAE